MDTLPSWTRPMAWCLLALGLLLSLAPILDLAAGLGSMNVGAVPWRFGAAGLLSGALVLPVFGLGLLLVASATLGQRTLVRLLGIIAILLLLALGVIAVIFGLDALQVRGGIRQDAKRAFDLATLKALVTFVLEIGVLATLGRNALQAARLELGRGPRKSASPLVVPSRAE